MDTYMGLLCNSKFIFYLPSFFSYFLRRSLYLLRNSVYLPIFVWYLQRKNMSKYLNLNYILTKIYFLSTKVYFGNTNIFCVNTKCTIYYNYCFDALYIIAQLVNIEHILV